MRTRISLPLLLTPLLGACFSPPSGQPDYAELVRQKEGRSVVSGRVNPRDLSGRELRKAYRGFLAYLRLTRETQSRLELAEKGVERFSGTRYESDLRKIVAQLRDALKASEFIRLLNRRRWYRLSPAQRVQFFEDIKPRFAGTRFADIIDKSIEQERRAAEKAGSR
jgi:hypothetical protein